MTKEDKHEIQALRSIADIDLRCRGDRGLLSPAVFSHLNTCPHITDSVRNSTINLPSFFSITAILEGLMMVTHASVQVRRALHILIFVFDRFD